MEKLDKCIFPLTSLQIGDLQSYLSELNVFLANESDRLYILVDNRPWLRDLISRPEYIWQLMVTKSRLSPFANTKAQRRRKPKRQSCCQSKPNKRWFSLVDTKALSKKGVLLPVEKIRKSLILSGMLHRTLYGFIVFEVAWINVRGINYFNELQIDTSLALEAKIMQRWEFESIQQAVNCMSLWFSGTISENIYLKDYLESSIVEVFYDAEENFSLFVYDDDGEGYDEDDISNSCCGMCGISDGMVDSEMDELYTPPSLEPYKRRVVKSNVTGPEADFHYEETSEGVEHSLDKYDDIHDDCGNNIEPKLYTDVLILLRFNDRDMPFKLKEIIMSDLRLLTLLEAGLPTWAIFLQSYPGLCNLYRPWMSPLARTLYVLISIITVLIGFYDLYKNVPVLKATVFHMCGPLFDWVDSWEMVSRIQYLGTMLFLQHFQKAIGWFLSLARIVRSFFAVITQPLLEPFMECIRFLLPAWNLLTQAFGSFSYIIYAVFESSYEVVMDLLQIILWPIWSLKFLFSNITTSILYPVFLITSELLCTTIRLILSLGSFGTTMLTSLWAASGEIWQSLSGIFRVATASDVTATVHEVSKWRSLWNDLFSQVFRAIRSIFYGLVAFFATCNRHRLSIYNHALDFIERCLARGKQNQSSITSNRRSTDGLQNLVEKNKRIINRESSPVST